MTIKQLSSSFFLLRPYPLLVEERRVEEEGKCREEGSEFEVQKGKNEGGEGRTRTGRRKSEDRTGQGPYLNDIVAGVHTRRLPLIAPL